MPKLTKKKARRQQAEANKLNSREAKQHAQDVARCRARYKEETAARSAFMASDEARFIVQRDWKRSLSDMVPATRLERYRRRGLRRFKKYGRGNIARRNPPQGKIVATAGNRAGG